MARPSATAYAALPLELDTGDVSIRDRDVSDEMERQAVQKRLVRGVRLY
jgi:hypothetical protein